MLWGLFRWKWFWRISLAIAILAIAIPWLTLLWIQSQGESELQKVIAKLDAEEPNWKLEQMFPARNERIRQMPKNSWNQVELVLAKLPKNWDQGMTEGTEGLSDLLPNQLGRLNHLQYLRELREDNREALALAMKLRDLPEGGRAFDLPENPFMLDLAAIQQVRAVMSLLSHASQEAAYAGRSDEAIQYTSSLMNTSRSIGDEPILISALVRMAGRGIATNCVRQCLALGEPTSELAAIQANLLKEADENLLTEAFRGERAFSHKTFILMANGDLTGTLQGIGVGPPGRWERLGLWAMKSYIPSNHRMTLEKMNEMIAISKKPFDEHWPEVKKLPKVTRSITTMFVALLMPALEKVTEASLRTRGEMLATATGVACERYRLKVGRWPDRLEDIPKEILPSIPNDPFTGKPICFRRLPDGLVVYSVGPDEKDNEGSVFNTKNGPRMTDFGIRLWDPEKRRQNPPDPDLPALPEEIQNPDVSDFDLPTVAPEK